jgi:hypothetical protein
MTRYYQLSVTIYRRDSRPILQTLALYFKPSPYTSNPRQLVQPPQVHTIGALVLTLTVVKSFLFMEF